MPWWPRGNAGPDGYPVPGGDHAEHQHQGREQYEALRRQGESKEKAARIANASAGSSRSQTGRKGGASGSYEDWSKDDLLGRARGIGIDGRSKMNKSQLVDALRNH